MRMNYLILGLVALSAVIGLIVFRDPERAAAQAQMYRDAALSPDAKQAGLLLIALAIGGYVAYLTISRR